MKSENLNFSLDFQIIKDIPFDKYEKDFTFVINENRYNTPRIIADILSPYIRRLHCTDPTINEITIDIKSEFEGQIPTNDYFEDFLNLALFQKTTIDSEKQKLFLKYFYLLENFDEYLNICSNYHEELTIDNAIQQLQTIYSKIPFINEIRYKKTAIDEIISFCSSHFEEIDKEKLKGLQIDILEEIIKNENLKINDEDSLLNFILSINDQTKSNLFQYVLLKNLSEEGLKKFIEQFDVEFFNCIIWQNICDSLLLRFNNNEEEKESKRYINEKCEIFKLKEGHEFEGIMNYLTEKTGGNIHDNKTIEITSNSINCDSQIPRNCVDYKNNNNYTCDYGTNEFICFDFKNLSVQVSSYSIQSRCDGSPNWIYLKNWVIEVKNENGDWVEIDRRENDASLNGPNYKSTFIVNKPQKSFYRFIRLRQTGASWLNDKLSAKFGIQFIEFHGKLKNNK